MPIYILILKYSYRTGYKYTDTKELFCSLSNGDRWHDLRPWFLTLSSISFSFTIQTLPFPSLLCPPLPFLLCFSFTFSSLKNTTRLINIFLLNSSVAETKMCGLFCVDSQGCYSKHFFLSKQLLLDLFFYLYVSIHSCLHRDHPLLSMLHEYHSAKTGINRNSWDFLLKVLFWIFPPSPRVISWSVLDQGWLFFQEWVTNKHNCEKLCCFLLVNCSPGVPVWQSAWR